MGARGPKKVQAVLARLGQGLLMAKHDAVRGIVDSSQGDQPSALGQLARSRDGKSLGVDVNARLGILLQQPAGAPVVEILRRPSVDVERLATTLSRLPQDAPDQI